MEKMTKEIVYKNNKYKVSMNKHHQIFVNGFHANSGCIRTTCSIKQQVMESILNYEANKRPLDEFEKWDGKID